MALSRDALDSIDTTKQVHIGTRSGDRVAETVIWVVVDDGEVFVRSVRGERGIWYQRALTDPQVSLRVGDRRFSFQALPANDPETVERVSEALRRKYRPGGSLDSMLHPSVLDTTLRLEPLD